MSRNIETQEIVLQMCPSRTGHNYIKNNIFAWLDQPFHPIYEDYRPLNYYKFENVILERFEDLYKKKLDETNWPTLAIVSNRDLLNWWASFYRFYETHEHTPSVVDEPWKAYEGFFRSWSGVTEEMFGKTNHLAGHFDRIIPIIFDRFCSERSYRKQICEQIGPHATYNENMLNFVPGGGGGSSFDKFDYQDKGSEMKVLDRYEQLTEPEIAIVAHYPRAVELYKKYWNPTANPKKAAILARIESSY